MLPHAREPVSQLQALRVGERAAFHASPLDGVPRLRDLLQRRPSARLAWLLGVCLGASGRYGDAIDVLTPIAHPPGTTPGGGPAGGRPPVGRPLGADDARVASLASSTLGSLYRQLGRHAEGRILDERALDLLTTTGTTAHTSGFPLIALVDARLGLAADAVGLRDLPRAESELAAAIRALPGRNGASAQPHSAAGSAEVWRVRARSCWVRCEVALLHADVSTALVAARESIRLARAARAPRHEAKGLLFASVAEAGMGRIDTAVDVVTASMRRSVELGAWPLVWPAAIVLSDLLDGDRAGSRQDGRLTTALALGALAVDLITAGLPEPLASQWRNGADVQRLLQRVSVRIV